MSVTTNSPTSPIKEKPSIWKKYLLFSLIPLLFAVSYFVYFRNLFKSQEVHYHAGFLVYVSGVKQDFSDFKYMHTEKCSNEGAHAKEDPQLEKAHLHDEVGDVVHVHRSNAKWQDLFRNIGFTFPSGLPIKGYVNGQPIDNILSLPILPNESVIIVAGSSNGINLKEYVSLDHIKEIESKSESCGS